MNSKHPVADWTIILIAYASIFFVGSVKAETKEKPAVSEDWPQWRGPTRQGIAGGQKFADSWPKDGPRQLWKSAWFPGVGEGGAGSPVVTGGKVFLYVNWMRPVGGGRKYRLVTKELLLDAGWSPDIPEALAKRIEEAWASAKRPNCAKAPAWYAVTGPKDEEYDAFLAKTPDLESYIKEFLATLPAEDAKKYGAYVRRRLCITAGSAPTGGFNWDQLVQMSQWRDKETDYVWNYQKKPGSDLFFNKNAFDGNTALFGNFIPNAWVRASVRSDALVCLDAATGKELWKKDFPMDRDVAVKFFSMAIGGFGQVGASGTPTIWEDKCYFAGAMGLYCLSAKDGTLRWQVKGEPTHASPLVAKGVVYHSGAAYNAVDGKLIWKNPQWKPNYRAWEFAAVVSSAVLWSAGGKDYIITTDGNRSWCCLEFETGKVLWSVLGSPNIFSPVFSGDIMILRGASQVEAYRVTPSAATSLWKQTVKDNSGSYTISHECLYVCGAPESGASWSCLDLKTGEIKWTQRFVGETLCTVPVLADGKLINAFGKGHYDGSYQIEMIKAISEKYILLGVFNPRACIYTSPVIVGGKMYLRLEDSLACYDLKEQ